MTDDAEMMRELMPRARAQIRARMRALRAAHPRNALLLRSERIASSVAALDVFERARAVALFWPLAHEVDLRSLDVVARAAGKRVFYPVMDPTENGHRTGFAEVSDSAELQARGSRFAEPPPEAPRASRGDIDCVVVPALAVSASGHRLGYGVGFYDVTLPDVVPPAVSVVVAFDFQLLAELPVLEHDVACHYVVTDRRTLQATLTGSRRDAF